MERVWSRFTCPFRVRFLRVPKGTQNHWPDSSKSRRTPHHTNHTHTSPTPTPHTQTERDTPTPHHIRGEGRKRSYYYFLCEFPSETQNYSAKSSVERIPSCFCFAQGVWLLTFAFVCTWLLATLSLSRSRATTVVCCLNALHSWDFNGVIHDINHRELLHTGRSDFADTFGTTRKQYRVETPWIAMTVFQLHQGGTKRPDLWTFFEQRVKAVRDGHHEEGSFSVRTESTGDGRLSTDGFVGSLHYLQ